MQHFSVQDVTFQLERRFVGFRDLEQAGDVTGVLRSLKEMASQNLMLISTESLGQSVLTLSTANKLKRSERQTLSEHESSLSQSTVFGARPYLIYRIMMQYECLPLWIRYITYTWVQQNMF